MIRHTVLLITLFYVFGTVGIPVVAYSCLESAEAGVVSGSPRSCYADACCDGDQDPPNVRFQSDIPCCDLSVQAAPENGMLLPGQKYGQANPLAEAPARFDASRPDARAASTPPTVSVFRASIKLPLLI